MDSDELERWQSKARSQDDWTVKDLTEFFEVSHTTIRKRIKAGDLTATRREIETGYRLEVSGDELARNISQNEQLQSYLEAQESADKPKAIEQGEKGGRPRTSDLHPGELYRDLMEAQREVGELREQLGEERARREELEKQVRDLSARLEELSGPAALPSGRAVLESGISYVKSLPIISWFTRDK